MLEWDKVFLKIATVTLTLIPRPWKLNLLEILSKHLCEVILKFPEIVYRQMYWQMVDSQSENLTFYFFLSFFFCWSAALLGRQYKEKAVKIQQLTLVLV